MNNGRTWSKGMGEFGTSKILATAPHALSRVSGLAVSEKNGRSEAKIFMGKAAAPEFWQSTPRPYTEFLWTLSLSSLEPTKVCRSPSKNLATPCPRFLVTSARTPMQKACDEGGLFDLLCCKIEGRMYSNIGAYESWYTLENSTTPSPIVTKSSSLSSAYSSSDRWQTPSPLKYVTIASVISLSFSSSIP
eukprot:05517_5